MKESLKTLFFAIGLVVGANVIAWGIEMLRISNDGDILVVGGGLSMFACLLLVWFVRNALARLVWFATMSYVSLIVGFDSHIEFHKAYGSHSALQAFIMAVFIFFLIAAILRKNFIESPGK